MSGEKEGDKGKGTGRAGYKGKGASRNNTTDMRPSASATTDTSVQPPPPGSPPRAAASMTLASMSLTASATPLLVSGTVAEVEVLTGSDKDGVTDAQVTAGAHTTDETRKRKDSECKKKGWSEAAVVKIIELESSTCVDGHVESDFPT